MIKKTKDVYYCEYCGKHYLNTGHAKRHERWCKKNPMNLRPCHKCKYNIIKELSRDFEHQNYTSNDTFLSPYCSKHKQFMFVPTIKRFNWFKIHGPDEQQIPMPETCKDFKKVSYLKDKYK